MYLLLANVKALLVPSQQQRIAVAQKQQCHKYSMTTPSGSILPEPKRMRFSYLSVIASVATGLLIGATISKNVANFLEENELFVPSDDDDDDDDD